MEKIGNKNKILVLILSIVMLFSLTAMGTYALFVDSSRIAGNTATAGSVKISASLEISETSSMGVAQTTPGTFANGGTAAIEEGKLVSSGMTAGDKVALALSIKNESNVNIKYRVIVSASVQDPIFEMSFNDSALTGDKAMSDWSAVVNPGAVIPSQSIEIGIPENAVQGDIPATAEFDITVYAVQGNGADEVVFASSLADLTSAAADRTVVLIKDIVESGAVVIDSTNHIDLNGCKLEGTSVSIGNAEYTGTVVIENGTISATDVGGAGISIAYPKGTVAVKGMVYYVGSAETPISFSTSGNTLHMGDNVAFLLAGRDTPVALTLESGTRLDMTNTTDSIRIKVADGAENVKIEDNRPVTPEISLPEVTVEVPADATAIEVKSNERADVPIVVTGDGAGNVTMDGLKLWDGVTAVEVVPAGNVYTVKNGSELAWIAKSVNEGKDFSGMTVVLAGDVNLNGKAWTPIGSSYRKSAAPKCFSGTFDGAGHTVFGLTDEGYAPAAEDISDGEYLFGLFGFVRNAVIENVNLSNVSISGPSGSVEAVLDTAGALVGYSDQAVTIDNCRVLGGTIQGVADTAGAILGRSYGTVAAVTNCSNAASVSGAGKVGGIVGAFSSNASDGAVSVTVKSCTNDGAIVGNSGGQIIIGGIVGFTGNVQKVEIVGCINDGSVTLESGKTSFAGGILAYDMGFATKGTSIVSCTNNGVVTGNAVGGMGGILGFSNAGAGLNVASCTNIGAVGSATCGNVGGIVGWTNDSSAVSTYLIENNENSGTIVGNKAGGIGGFIYAGTVSGNINRGAITGLTNYAQIVYVSADQKVTLADNQELWIPIPTSDEYFVFTLFDGDIPELFGKYGVAKAEGKKMPEQLVIPSEHEGIPVVYVEYDGFIGCTEIKSVYIPDSVIAVDGGAFSDCTNLAEIRMSKNVEITDSGMFHNTAWLANQPDGPVYIAHIFYSWKGNVPANTVIEFREGTTVYGARAITSVSSADLDNIVGVRFPASMKVFEFDFMLTLGHAAPILSYEVDPANPYYTAIDGNLFSKDGKIMYRYAAGKTDETLIVPDGTEKIFDACMRGAKNLKHVVFPDSVVEIQDAIFGNTSLDTIVIGSGIQIIGGGTFDAAEMPVSITIKSEIPPTFGPVFGSSGTTYYVPADSVEAYKAADGWKAYAAKIQPISTDNKYFTFTELNGGWSIAAAQNETMPETLVLPAEYQGKPVTALASSAFKKKTEIKSVSLPDSITSIGNSAFSGCSSLSDVRLGAGVKTVGEYAFASCSALTSLTLPKSVTTVGECAFGSQLKSLIILGNVNFDFFAFNDAPNVENFVIGKDVTAFDGEEIGMKCENRSSVILEEGNTAFSISGNCLIEKATKTLRLAWSNASGDPVAPTDGSVEKIGAYAFASTGVTEISLPNVTDIYWGAFSLCASLKSVTFGPNLDSMEGYAFKSCVELESVTIPASVTFIGESAFFYCPKLTITCEATQKPSKWNSSWSGSSQVIWKQA